MKYGLIGEHLGHSYSPQIHRKIGNYDYTLRELSPDELAPFLERRNFNAINVTIPYKQMVIPYLFWLSDDVKRTGAVNTIVNRAGTLYGYNTDYDGMRATFLYKGLNLLGKKVLILGTGGTSKTARTAAASLGAASVVCVSRSEKQDFVTYETAIREHRDAQIIINTTPAGMYPDVGKSPIDITSFPELEGIMDVIYNPLRTELVLDGLANGVPAVGGLYMLVAQAVHASSLFFGKSVDKDSIDSVYLTLLEETQNIALIGMSGAGKTDIGKQIAELTGKTFIDTDAEIMKKADMPITEIFKRCGEIAFRKLEHDVIREISVKSGCVIATGGGAVLDAHNIRVLRRNSVICFLDRSPEMLAYSADRPLASTRRQSMELYNQRHHIYQAAADITVNNDRSIPEAAKAVIERARNEAFDFKRAEPEHARHERT